MIVLLGRGDGSFQNPITTQANLLDHVAGDVNGDGKADVIGLFNDTLFVYSGKGDGTFELGATYKFGTNWGGAALALGDFNGDARTDVIVTTGTDPALTTGWPVPGQAIVFLGNGDGTFQDPITSAIYMNGFPMTADFNGDGNSDLGMTLCDLTAGCIHWLLSETEMAPFKVASRLAPQGIRWMGRCHGQQVISMAMARRTWPFKIFRTMAVL